MLRPVVPAQRIKADSHPDHIERHRRPRAVIGAVDDESGGADDVHDLVKRRARLDLAEGQQAIGAENERGGHPSGNCNEGLQRHER